MTTDPCQRWHRKREFYEAGAAPINARRYGVELISEDQARDFLQTHHYAGADSYPATQVRVGLFRCTGYTSPELVGAMVFGIPSSSASFAKWTPGLPTEKGTVLQRLAIVPGVEANGETWFLGRAFEALRSELPQVRVVLSYSDPVPRMNEQGVEYKPGHIGRIYQAHNGVYLGTTARDDTYLLPSGEIIAPRSMSKLRNSERGGARLEQKLLEKGAPARLPGESDRDYAYRLVRGDLFLRRRRRPGNHVYAWPVVEARSVRQELVNLWDPKPYPKLTSDFTLGPASFERSAA